MGFLNNFSIIFFRIRLVENMKLFVAEIYAAEAVLAAFAFVEIFAVDTLFTFVAEI